MQKASFLQRNTSRFVGHLFRSRVRWIKNLCIRLFVKYYNVDLSESQVQDADDFASFESFFTRELKPGCRPIDVDPSVIVSPVDATIAEYGTITQDGALGAKGREYLIEELVKEAVGEFEGGTYIVLYLSPRDYHRVHMPVAANLVKTREIPGQLYSVNDASFGKRPKLFCCNERLVCFLESNGRPLIVVLIGALIVASISTNWAGPKSPYWEEIVRHLANVSFAKAEEFARFTLGSTVILLFPETIGCFDDLNVGQSVRLGERIGVLRTEGEL